MTQALPPTDPLKAFQERVVEKLKGEIGTMLPDEALSALTMRAMEEMLFADQVTVQSYGPNVVKPSWFKQEVVKIATPLIEAKVQEMMDANRERIQTAIEETLTQPGMTLLAAKVIADSVRDSMAGLGADIVMQLQSRGVIR